MKECIDNNIPAILQISFDQYETQWVVAVGYAIDEEGKVSYLLTLDPRKDLRIGCFWNGILNLDRCITLKYGFQPDKVTRTNNRVDVQLNLGNRFQTVDWRGIGEISTNSSTTKSENVSFTINFYPFGGKLAITPGYNRSSGMSRPNYELRDIDGDGFLDVLESDNESDLRVHCSTIARTNKLKTVTNSLGGKFTIDYKRSIPTYGL